MKKTIKRFFARFMAAALAVVVVASMFACSPDSNSEETQETDISELEKGPIEIPVLAQDIEIGERITTSMLTTKTINRYALSATMMTSVDDVAGQYATVKLYKGDYIYKDELSSKKPVTATVETVDSYISKNKYIDVTQFVSANTGEDLYDSLQKIIDNNPQKTIYFPDGEYIISSSLKTSAMASKGVSIYLSDNAVIKASNNWKGGDNALIRLGASAAYNDITSIGSNYFFMGGTLDGNKKAMGISLDSGRESLVSKVKIINATVGVYVPDGVNNHSSDMDIEDIDIVGFGASSIGIKSVGLDNTFTDIRISNVKTGVSNSGGSFFRGISVRLDADANTNLKYEDTVAFSNTGAAWYYSCSSENMRVGFYLNSGDPVIKDFSIRWTQAKGDQIAFESQRSFNAYCSNGIIDFFDETTNNSIVKAGSLQNSAGILLDVIADVELCDEENYKNLFKISTADSTTIGGSTQQGGGQSGGGQPGGNNSTGSGGEEDDDD